MEKAPPFRGRGEHGDILYLREAFGNQLISARGIKKEPDPYWTDSRVKYFLVTPL